MINENDLILQAKGGNKDAATKLLTQYEPLLNKAAHQSHLKPIAEDALAEAQMEFLTAIQKYDLNSEVPFAGYVKAMVYGRMLTLFRQALRIWQREEMPFDRYDEDDSSFWDNIADGHDDIGSFVERESLRSALERLTPRQREVIQLLYFADLTQAEVAKRLGITQQAVAKIKAKGVELIRNSECAIQN